MTRQRGHLFTEAERRTSHATAQARAVAFQAELMPIMREMQASGITSLGALAQALMDRGIPTARGFSTWSRMQVYRILKAEA